MTNIILNIYQCIMFVFCRYAIVKTNDSEESYVIALDRKEEFNKYSINIEKLHNIINYITCIGTILLINILYICSSIITQQYNKYTHIIHTTVFH